MGSDIYYLSIKAPINRRHLIHRSGCPFLPGREQRIFLGEFENDDDPANESRLLGMNSRKCSFCCSSDHEVQPSDAMHLISTIPEEQWDSALISGVN